MPVLGRVRLNKLWTCADVARLNRTRLARHRGSIKARQIWWACSSSYKQVSCWLIVGYFATFVA